MTAQHMSALQLANDTRLRKARFKEQLAAMPRPAAMLAAADVIAGGDDRDGSWRVSELVSAIPQMRSSRARDLARYAMATPDAQLRRLSHRQRAALADGLRNPRLVWPFSHVQMEGAA